MYGACLIKILKYILHLYLLSSKTLTTYKGGFNKFPLFDDDKPNDHIDPSREPSPVLDWIQFTQQQAITKKNFQESQLIQGITQTSMVILIFPLLASSKNNESKNRKK